MQKTIIMPQAVIQADDLEEVTGVMGGQSELKTVRYKVCSLIWALQKIVTHYAVLTFGGDSRRRPGMDH